ncbi:MAG: DUF4251 domain-containing protein [Prevotella sp.]|jgi:hypothetical protein
MRKYFLIFIVLLSLAGCGTTKLTPQRQQALEQSINDKRFTVEVNYCMPMRMPSRSLTSEYFVKVTPDTLYSALPYFGEARNVPYGGGTGLNFSAPIKEMGQLERKNDEQILPVTVDHEGDLLTYYFHLFDNGKVTLDVISRERDNISFLGEIK